MNYQHMCVYKHNFRIVCVLVQWFSSYYFIIFTHKLDSDFNDILYYNI